MFLLATVADTVRIPPAMFAQPTLTSVHQEIEKKYPNRVLMDVGLVICLYGNALKVGDGICVAGDGGAHHEVVFQVVVFRPFVDEVCIGSIIKSTAEGIVVGMGEFFEDVFIPAYWMLSPSRYDAESGLWIWTPNYDDDDDDDEEEEEEDGGEGEGEGEDEGEEENKEENKGDDKSNNGETIKTETQDQQQGNINNDNNENENEKQGDNDNGANDNSGDGNGGERFEMYLGSQVRFKVKSINFTQVTNTAKGVQATTTTTSKANNNLVAGGPLGGTGSGAGAGAGAGTGTGTSSSSTNSDAAAAAGPGPPNGATNTNTTTAVEQVGSSSSNSNSATTLPERPLGGKPVRKRSTSVDLTDTNNIPASMHIVGSICEDGLGLISWWTTTAGTEEEEAEQEQGGEEEEEQQDDYYAEDAIEDEFR